MRIKKEQEISAEAILVSNILMEVKKDHKYTLSSVANLIVKFEDTKRVGR